MSKTLTAEEYLDKNFNSKGNTFLRPAKWVFEFATAYANYLHKAKVKSVIDDDSIDAHGEDKETNFFENWMVEKQHEYHNIPIEELLQDYGQWIKQKLL